MFLHELFETVGLKSRLMVDSPAFKAWFGNSKVVDDAGNPLPVYHGTARPDRVGNRFRKSRATAGPMAYFTDDPTIASNYSTSKPDTSMGGEYPDYSSWFKAKVKGIRSEIPIDRLWYFLPSEEKQRIATLAPTVRQNDDGEIISDPKSKNGPGGLDYTVKEKRDNYLAALVEQWLNGGILFGDEGEFLKVLKLCGLTTPVRMDDPDATYPAVYAVYMSIQNPLVSTSIPQAVLNALEKGANRQKIKRDDNPVYQWDKNSQDGRSWFRSLLNDIEATGGRMSWTVIPDWVTKILKSFGYDGIKDVGGKNGGGGHTVWIPFEEHQVKSAISNTNFDPNKKSIHEKIEQVEIGYMDKNFNSHLLAVKVLYNPTKKEFEKFSAKYGDELRGLLSSDGKDIWLWDAMSSVHYKIAEELGLKDKNGKSDANYIYYSQGKWSGPFLIDKKTGLYKPAIQRIIS